MAPDAPPPVYDEQGNIVSGWRVTASYDPRSDSVLVVAHQEEGAYHAERTWTAAFAPTEPEDAIAEAQRHMRIFSARRLF